MISLMQSTSNRASTIQIRIKGIITMRTRPPFRAKATAISPKMIPRPQAFAMRLNFPLRTGEVVNIQIRVEAMAIRKRKILMIAGNNTSSFIRNLLLSH